MTTGVAIGEFARLCHLSAKTLRYYHDIDLLVPAAVDESTGYRRYSTTQVGDAHLIRRLRDLDMPIADIRRVLEAEAGERESALAGHLDRMESQLARTREVVISLRRLLGTAPRLAVTHRRSPATTVLRIAARLPREEVAAWCGQTYPELYASLDRYGLEPAGPGGATYSAEFFERAAGEVVAFVPVLPESIPAGEASFGVLPSRRVAVAVHAGPFTDCDLTYGWLGIHVAEHDISLGDPIVENYLVGPDQTDDPNQFQTEICWPVQ
jgi:DNA-binding transcriptional MerR regulator